MNQTHLTIEQIIDYERGELSPHEDATVRAHLTRCAACGESHQTEVRLGELLREHARAAELELPPGLVTSIFARVASESNAPSWWQRLSALLRPIVAIPVGAAVVVAIYFAAASGWHAGAKNDAADAAYYMESHAALATTMPFEEGDAIPTVLTSDETDR